MSEWFIRFAPSVMAFFRELPPSERPQCSRLATEMMNQGGCTRGTPEERLEWRRQHMERRRTQGWPSGRADPECCSRTARYEVGGHPFCVLHAGQEALALCLEACKGVE